MRKTIRMAALLLVANLYGSAFSYADSSADTDILDLMVPVLAVFGACEEGEFATCTTRPACLHINGIWVDDTCLSKPENRLFTEQLAGRWSLFTVFPQGNNRNYFMFDKSAVERIADTKDYSIEGEGHLSKQFNTADPVHLIGAYDSSMKDWFILEIWGEDIGLASFYEFAFTSTEHISGCERFVSYPDLRYTDGICYPFTGDNSEAAKNVNLRLDDIALQDKRSSYQLRSDLARASNTSIDSKTTLAVTRKLVHAALHNKITNN